MYVLTASAHLRMVVNRLFGKQFQSEYTVTFTYL